MDKLFFEGTTKKDFFIYLSREKKRKIINFLNQHDLYQKRNLPVFNNALKNENNINLMDGFFISAFLSAQHLKRLPRTRGPTFTRDFLSNPELSGNKTHFFIGINSEDLNSLRKSFPHLKKISSYNPPFIKELSFSKEEIKKMTALIKKSRADFVWVCVGSPKQNILSQDLFPLTKSQYFFNVGAALDFLLGKKKEAPLIFREIGLEWFYRLITDFKYTKKKVWRSLIGVFYLITGRVRIGIRK